MATKLAVLITGATGNLGRSVLSELVTRPRPDVQLFATYHRQPTLTCFVESAVKWLQYDLRGPPVFLAALPSTVPLLTLHFACSCTRSMNTAFPVDCLGTFRLIDGIKSRAPCATNMFIFASSIAAEWATDDYGVAKRYIEDELFARAQGRFRAISVRVPVVQNDNRSVYDIPIIEFGTRFLSCIEFDTICLALLSTANRPQSLQSSLLRMP
jgi:nucleoside-diphosphate-sugar epimerase